MQSLRPPPPTCAREGNMSHPKTVLPLGAFLSACLLAAVHAQTPACDTLAVASDPATSDSLYPPTLPDVQIPSSGARMNGVLYVAQGKGPHTTVLVLHGFPGTEKNGDLAQVVRRAGFNALIFHYRGALGQRGGLLLQSRLRGRRCRP